MVTVVALVCLAGGVIALGAARLSVFDREGTPVGKNGLEGKAPPSETVAKPGVGGGLGVTSATPRPGRPGHLHRIPHHQQLRGYQPQHLGDVFPRRGPPLAISDVSILEGNNGATAFVFTVRLSASSSQAVSVNYATADGSATAGSDTRPHPAR
jgi:hypothetical protein